jgi:hypothetical protein
LTKPYHPFLQMSMYPLEIDFRMTRPFHFFQMSNCLFEAVIEKAEQECQCVAASIKGINQCDQLEQIFVDMASSIFVQFF